MATNPKASELVLELQAAAKIIQTQAGNLGGLLGKYQILDAMQQQATGEPFIHQHFVDASGQPRSDLFITEAQINAFVAALSEINTVILKHLAITVTVAN